MTNDWKAEFERAHKETTALLDSFEQVGLPYKRIGECRFVECDWPTWEGTSESEGIVTIDPSKHEPRCVAHEMGHGFHECLRRDIPDLWHDDDNEGETVAETVRFFVEQRLWKHGEVQWLPKAKHTKILDACDYKVNYFRGMLQSKYTLEQAQEMKRLVDAAQFHPMVQQMERERKQRVIDRIRKELGRHVVVVCRKGGRIKEEHRYDSESDSYEEVVAVELSIGTIIANAPGGIGIGLIGRGKVGYMPWQISLSGETNWNAFTEAENFDLHSPVRVADVVENSQTGVTTIYLESV